MSFFYKQIKDKDTVKVPKLVLLEKKRRKGGKERKEWKIKTVGKTRRREEQGSQADTDRADR